VASERQGAPRLAPRTLTLLCAAVAIACGLGGAGPATAALTPTVTSFPSSDPVSPQSHPYAIAAGPDGNLWFTDPYTDRIGRMTVDGRLTLQAPVPGGGFTYGIAAGGDGAMWFVHEGPSRVSRIDADGNVLSQSFADPFAQPRDIAPGPEGALWIAELGERAIGRIPATTPLAAPDESRATTDSPNSIVAGPDGNLWFTQHTVSSIGRMTPAGAATYFPLPTGIEKPEDITVGPDGNLWYTALNPPSVVRITTDGTQVSFPSPVTPSPGKIVAGADGALWFTAFDEIVRVELDGSMEAFPVPGPDATANGIAAGPDGNLWFTDQNPGLIGRITTPPNAATGPPQTVGARSARVTATVEGHSQPTGVAIEYAAPGGEARSTAALQLPPSAAQQPVTIALDGLSPVTPYRYRVVATNPTGTASGAFAELTTVQAPSCRVIRTRRGRGGKVIFKVSCVGTDSVFARATAKVPRKARRRAGTSARKRTIVYGTAFAKVFGGRATIGIRPRKPARAQLRLRRRLPLAVTLTATGGGTSETISRRLKVRLPAKKKR
jgi:streptogramin lyase